MNYKKEYSGETAEFWLSRRKWTGFLMNIPVGEQMEYFCTNANDVMTIRSTASQLSRDPECDRTFSVFSDLERKSVKITVKLKEND